MACEAVLIEGFPKAEIRQILYDGELYTRSFFYGLVSTTATGSQYPQWDANKTDYKIGDVVNIADLKTDFICGENGNRDFPPSTSAWKPRTANDYRQTDNMPTTKTISSDNIVINIYDIHDADYIVGQFIDGVGAIRIDTLDANMNMTGTLVILNMRRFETFTCFSCCNPKPELRRHFVQSLKDTKCSDRYVRVILYKEYAADYIEIGTIVTVQSVYAGKPDGTTKIYTDNGIEFRRVGINDEIDAVQMGSTVSLTGVSEIGGSDKRKLYEKLKKYKGMTFTMIEKAEVIDDVIMGKFTTPDGFQISGYEDYKTTFNFKKEGVLA